MENLEMMFSGFYKGKKVLVTGHTGFKGSWLCRWLLLLGAEVAGFSLDPYSHKDHFIIADLQNKMRDMRGDVRDKEVLGELFKSFQPDLVFHLAAQPLVRLSYAIPDITFETNIMGTVNVLENSRLQDSVKAAVIVTSDKCYENKEQIWGYRESDPMGGYDPYSCSKGCAELVASAYERSFFTGGEKGVATVRAGNVIGGGDWSADRLVPDCVRALLNKEPIILRNPHAVRPWQHVLEPLYGYLLLGERLFKEPKKFSGPWNFAPNPESQVPVGKLAETLVSLWGSGEVVDKSDPHAVHEASLLTLDFTKARFLLGWTPVLKLEDALSFTLDWYKHYNGPEGKELSALQIARYADLRERSFL